VTITHPHHPLYGQQLPVDSVRRGENPDVIVRLPDGSHARVALSSTHRASGPFAAVPSAGTRHLLEFQGLRQIAQFIDALRQQGRLPGPAR
jgi:hypothetical protein